MKGLGPAAEIWQLEIDLWQSVQRYDLVRYRGFWHRNFSGWPHFYKRRHRLARRQQGQGPCARFLPPPPRGHEDYRRRRGGALSAGRRP
jgi:hypothetical protein